jgi:hypothetical protein
MQMRSFRFLFNTAVSFLTLLSATTFGDAFNDGGVHVIDYEIEGYVSVDYGYPGIGTRLEIVTGGSIQRYLDMYNDGQVVVDGGSVGTDYEEYGDGASARDNSYLSLKSGSIIAVWANDNSTVEIEGGSIPYGLVSWDNSGVSVSGGVMSELFGFGDSTVEVSGGTVNTWTVAGDNAEMMISGGQFNYGFFAGRHDSSDYGITEAGTIIFAGSDFTVNGHAMGYGESALLYANPVNYYGYDGMYAFISGTLDSGQSMSEDCYIFGESDVLFVPEPGMLMLFGLGVMLLRKRNR